MSRSLFSRSTSHSLLFALSLLAAGHSVLGQSTGGEHVQPNDWPMMGYDSRNTRSNPHEQTVTASNVSRLRLEWSQGFSCSTYTNCAVVDGVLYTGDYCSSVYAFDARTGRTIWTQYVNGVTGGPAVGDGVVYVGSRHSPTAYALDASDGSVLWTAGIGGILVDDAPTLAGNVVYFGVTDGRLYALDARTGATVWIAVPGGNYVGTPAVANDVVYVTARDPTPPLLSALNARTGSVLWTFPLAQTSIGYANSFYPSVADGVVYVGGDRLHALDAATGLPIWSATGSAAWWYQALGSEGKVVYACTSNGELCAVDAVTGQSRWCASVGTGAGIPCVAGGVVYVTEVPGPSHVHAFDAVSGVRLWSEALGALAYDTWAPVSVADGLVYVPVTFGYRIDAFRVPTPTRQAEYRLFGDGCAGSAGTPGLAPSVGHLPWVGAAFQVEIEPLPSGTLRVPFGILGLSRSSTGSLGLPFDLGTIGMPGCTLYVSTDDAVTLTNRGGRTTWSVTLPNESALLGRRFYQQGFVLDPRANPLGGVVSNAGEATIGG